MVRKSNRRLRPNDYVYVYADDEVRKPRNLDCPATRPFRVLAANNRCVFVDHDGMVDRISADRAMYASPPGEEDCQEPDQLIPTEADLKAKCKDGPEYIVEKLLSHLKGEDSTLYFKIKWAYYDDLTYERRDCILEKLISRCYRRLRCHEARMAAARPPQS